MLKLSHSLLKRNRECYPHCLCGLIETKWHLFLERHLWSSLLLDLLPNLANWFSCLTFIHIKNFSTWVTSNCKTLYGHGDLPKFPLLKFFSLFSVILLHPPHDSSPDQTFVYTNLLHLTTNTVSSKSGIPISGNERILWLHRLCCFSLRFHLRWYQVCFYCGIFNSAACC